MDEGSPATTDWRNTVDELIIEVLNGTASSFEQERLRRWREADEANEALYREAAQVWALTEPEPVPIGKPAPPVDEILETSPHGLPVAEGGRRRESGETPRGNTRAVRPRAGGNGRAWVRFGLLAASVGAVGLGLSFFSREGPLPSATYDAPSTNRTVTLTDGSFVRLAQGSSLKEWDTEGRRKVSLFGRAFFAVARDESRPFEVETDQGTVMVLGTRFQVDARPGGVETVVVEGLVEVANELGSIQVPAGSVASMGVAAEPSARQVARIQDFLSWPEGSLIFQSTPLSQVVQEVSEHFGVTLRIDEAARRSLDRRRITAWFQGEPFETVAESLCMVAEATCRADGDAVIMGIPEPGGTP